MILLILAIMLLIVSVAAITLLLKDMRAYERFVVALGIVVICCPITLSLIVILGG